MEGAFEVVTAALGSFRRRVDYEALTAGFNHPVRLIPCMHHRVVTEESGG